MGITFVLFSPHPYSHTHTHPPPLPMLQIVCNSRLGAHNVGNDCLMTMDGTDFRIPQKGIVKKGNVLAPHKLCHKYVGKFALWYKLGVDILVGNLVWMQGPYPAGKYTQIKKIKKVLTHFPEPGERRARQGCLHYGWYVGHADKTK